MKKFNGDISDPSVSRSTPLLGDKTYSRLKETSIRKLTKYYHTLILAISIKDVAFMKNSILASFNFCSSTDENPKHDKCSNDENSWCFYNYALAMMKFLGSIMTTFIHQ